MHWWADKPNVLGGRDLQAGGTWLGVHRSGRFATVTNHRDADRPPASLESRGHLVSGFLESDLPVADYLQAIDGERFAGFNLFVHDGEDLAYMSNRGVEARTLEPGIYAVANATLDTPWPKVQRVKVRLRALVDDGRANQSALLKMLDDRQKARVAEVRAGKIPFERAHALTAPFIVMPDYGTRSSTVLIRSANGRTQLAEKRFDAAGTAIGQSEFEVASALSQAEGA